MDKVIKDLGRLDVLDVECYDFGGYKRCKINVDPDVSLHEMCHDVRIWDVDSVATDGHKTSFLILGSVHCRLERGDDILSDPDKNYLICGKSPASWEV